MKTLDTRDLWKRKNELEDLKKAVEDAREEIDGTGFNSETPRAELPPELSPLVDMLDSALEDFGEDEEKELDELENLESEISDFRHGATMIPESDFEEYAQELADDIGAIQASQSWPYNHIDWTAAAEELKQDYTSVSYQGEDYYVRA